MAGKAQDDFIFWLGQESVRHPELAGIIRVGKEVISVAWNLLVANPVLCASVMAAFVAFGVIAVSAIKKARLKRKKMKGQVKPNQVKADEVEEKDNAPLVK